MPVSGGRFGYIKGGDSYLSAGLEETTISRGHLWEEGKAHCKNDRELHIGDWILGYRR